LKTKKNVFLTKQVFFAIKPYRSRLDIFTDVSFTAKDLCISLIFLLFGIASYSISNCVYCGHAHESAMR
jgi:hypothetical protein